ncbi:BTAD domain-containing putative transcriptional regulator [Psychromarinibacter sp. C21-152]|uniref:BTAD domain-containing putative transcriptional regulator n=1 Tax=Psychromarinibacter sediminicola TaxID=3033385 RepID=A0AAE3T8G4_9RHOB|nr:BTAD domain-containing putative transcriptional regulator [Psychromarinibacter sediminicola]MDF0600039.1 BTAD domain-containing putative transcriptional regulator [Psychromarinibacter sediminicola]
MTVRIRVLGQPSLTAVDGAPVRLTSRRSWALLAYLLQSGGRTLSRDDVADLLWPDSGTPQARASLRQELAVLRKALRGAGLDPIETGKATLRFTGGTSLADVTEMERRIAGGSQGDLREAAALYGGDFLDGLSLRSEPFTDWLEAERARLKALALGALDEQLRASVEAGAPPQVIRAAEAVLAVDPLREPAHRALMRALAEAGRKAAALRQYETCRAVLQRQLHVDPSAETRALAEEIRARPDMPPLPPEAEADDGGTSAAALVLVLPEAAALDTGFDPVALYEAQTQFSDFARRTVAELGGRSLSGPGDRVVALFAEPEAAALAALMVTAEPVPLAGAPAMYPAGGLARGALAVIGTAGLASVALHAAARSAALAGPGEVLAAADLGGALAESFDLAPGPADGLLRVSAPAETGGAPAESAPAETEPPGAEPWRAWRRAMARGALDTARQAADRAAALPGTGPGLAAVMTGGLALVRGRLAAAEEALVTAETLHSLPDGHGYDPGLTGRALLAWTQALRGRPGPAGETLRRVLSECEGAERPATLMLCQVIAAAMQEDLGETRSAQAAARAAFGAARGRPQWQAVALGLVGRARDRMGNAAGAAQMSEALAAYRAAGGVLMVPFFHAWMAEAGLEAGRAGEALVLADEGLSHGTASGVQVVEPELLRLQALALVRQGHGGDGQAEGAYMAAIEAARRIGAGLFELRAAVGFAAHLRRAGRPKEAAARLEAGLAAVETGGPPMADIRAARALQQRLSMD